MLPDKIRSKQTRGPPETESARSKDKSEAPTFSASRGISFRMDRAGDTFRSPGICGDANVAISHHLLADGSSLVPALPALGHHLHGSLVEAASIYPGG